MLGVGSNHITVKVQGCAHVCCYVAIRGVAMWSGIAHLQEVLEVLNGRRYHQGAAVLAEGRLLELTSRVIRGVQNCQI